LPNCNPNPNPNPAAGKGINIAKYGIDITKLVAQNNPDGIRGNGDEDGKDVGGSDDEYDMELVVNELEDDVVEKSEGESAYIHANIDILRPTEGEDARIKLAMLRKARGEGEGGVDGSGAGEAEDGDEGGGDERSMIGIQFRAMANKNGYKDDVVEFAKHWCELDSAARQNLIEQFYNL
jgi:hypothetical protein